MENKTIEKMFEDTDKAFHPLPFWAWTGKMTYREMEYQIREMLDKGIYEFIIFPLYGLEIPYLGEKWWEKVQWTLKKAEQLGMKVWIYDDYNWPSGTCAGRVLEDCPWSKAQKFGFKTFPVKKGGTVEWIPDGQLIGVFAQFSKTEAKSLKTENVFRKNKVTWKNNSGRNCKLVLLTQQPSNYVGGFAYGAQWCSRQTGYLDTLNPKAVEKFVRYTHAQYEKRVKGYFGGSLKGFFTDEPQISTFDGTYCSPFFLSEFKKRYGYGLETKIHELVVDAGDYLITRYHFWSLLSSLYSRNYIKRISDWCEGKKVLHTGHLLGEESLAWSVVYSGDVHEAVKWLHVPGMDLLGKETSYDSGKKWIIGNIDRKSLIVTAKLISSTARFAGGKRTLCEAFGVLDWSETMEEQKRVNDWLSALGINLINDNLLAHTIKGFRKRAISGKHFTSPWWKYYKLFTDYSARLSLMCARGKLEAETGVLYPAASAWCLMKPMANLDMMKVVKSQPEGLAIMENTLYATCDALLRIHRDFELLFDEVIANSSVEDGCLVAGNARFRTIILPGIWILTKDVYSRVQEFVKAGGKLITIGRPPEIIIDTKRNRSAGTKKIKRSIHLPYPKNELDFESTLESKLPLVDSSWIISGRGKRNVVSAARTLSGKNRILFMANQAPGSKSINVSWKFSSDVSFHDVDSGESFSVCPRRKENVSSVKLTFAPHQSICLVASHKTPSLPSIEACPLNPASKPGNTITLGEKWGFETETPNLLLLQFRLMPIKTSAGVNKQCPPLREDKRWLKVAEDGKAPVELSPENMQFFWLQSKFTAEHIPDNLSVVVDSKDYREVWLNGRKLTQRKPCTLWDGNNLRFPVKDDARPGKNVLTLKVKPSKYYSPQIRTGNISPYFIEPVVVSGDFVIMRDQRKQILRKGNPVLHTGSWTKQGYPYFAGTAIYSQEVTLNSIPRKACLEMKKVKEVAELRINGKVAGVRPWPPYIVKISDLLKEGKNKFEIRVTNSFANLLQSTYLGRKGAKKEAGILGPVHILTTE